MLKRSVSFIVVLVVGLVCGFYLSSIPAISENLKLNGLLQNASGKFWEEGKEFPPVISGGRPASFADLADKEKPAVVNISTRKTIKRQEHSPFDGFGGPYGKREQNPFGDFFGNDFFDRFFEGMPKEYRQQSLGSGFIISADGYIVTNNHVVENADDIKVKLSTGKVYDAQIVGRDKKTDLALIKIKGPDNLSVAVLGDSDKLRVGDWVMAIGNPFGFEHSVTVGVVSAKGRVIGAGQYDDFIQTDASINPGNSGGPLFDINGNVIGINSTIIAWGQGIGFAIPINLAKELLPQMKDKGKVRRAWLGVMVQDITEDLAKSFSLKSSKGALVADVVRNGPAEKAGIKRGDVITKFSGKEVENSHELSRKAASSEVGKKVEVILMREGQEKKFEVALEEYPSDGSSFGEDEGSEEGESAKLGISVQDITPEIAERLGSKDTKGVVISDVGSGSEAEDSGLRRGDIIKEVNRRIVNNVKDFKKEMGKAKLKDGILFLVQRGETTFFVTIKKG